MPPHFYVIRATLPGTFIVLLPDAPTFTIVAMGEELLRRTGCQAGPVVGRSVFVAYSENPAEAPVPAHLAEPLT
jgi:hypothetical protein